MVWRWQVVSCNKSIHFQALNGQRRRLDGLRRRHRERSAAWSYTGGDEAALTRRNQELEEIGGELRREHQTFLELVDELGLRSRLLSPQALITAATRGLRPGGCAVMVAVTEAGSVALLLPQGGAVVPVDLAFDRTGMRALFTNNDGTGWHDGYGAFRADLHATGGCGSAAGLAAWNACIAATLEALWAPLMAPIDAALSALGLSEGAEVTLVVPGQLSLLPLHAAGTRQNGRWHAFFDRWTVAYAPCLTFLAHRAERPAPLIEREERVLAVVDPLRDLGICFSAAEAAFPPAAIETVAGGRATRARVLEELPRATYACFDCHGVWAPGNSEESGLVLANRERLTPGDILATDLSGCRLAVLGACETALASVHQTADEHQGLPMALLHAGAGAVAATFWPIFNTTAEAIVSRLFRVHRHHGLPPAAALRRVLLELRDGGGGAANANTDMSAQPLAAVWGDGIRTPAPARTEAEIAAVRELVADWSQPIHWAIYGIFGG